MHQNKTDEAGALAIRIGKEITKFNASSLKSCNHKNASADMWDKVRHLLNKSHSSTDVVDKSITVVSLNQHFTNISSDPNYISPYTKSTAFYPVNLFSEYQVFCLLDRLHATATGPDQLPAWFLKLSAPIISSKLTYLLNLSISCSVTPTQWKSATIMPLPKVQLPKTLADFRPISITSVLSRAVERSIVQRFIYPSIISPPHTLTFADQFAFRPTGSTTAAIIANLHIITTLLASNPYVHVFALDFSKAFDSVCHSALMRKMAQLSLPDHIYNWLVSYFQGHTQATRFSNVLSPLLPISASVIQGSAIGPASFLVCAADLHPVHDSNFINKYADDCYLIIPAKNTNLCQQELLNVEAWAQQNNLKLNTAKTVEIIFTPGKSKHKVTLPPPQPNINRAESMVMLGVTIQNDLRMTSHVAAKVESCSKALFALKTLKAHGMPQLELHEVFRATAFASLLYAAPAWWGFTMSADRERLEAFLRKATKSGFYPQDASSVGNTVDKNEKSLFSAIITNQNHTLHSLLPSKKQSTHTLRPRAHPFQIPFTMSALHDKNFLIRMLRTDSY
jgi:hypothetical protein